MFIEAEMKRNVFACTMARPNYTTLEPQVARIEYHLAVIKAQLELFFGFLPLMGIILTLRVAV